MTHPTDLDQLIDLANKMADAAAAVTLPHFRSALGVENKDAANDGFDPVTIADRDAEAAMRALIDAHDPAHGIRGEEFGDREAAGDRVWFLDPIDGTRQFIAGLPMWGTLIGLEQGGKPLLGIADQPYIGERFVGSPEGAWLIGRGATTRLATSDCTALRTARLGTTAPQLFAPGDEKDRYDAVESRARLTRYGGDCYFYAMLAAGHLDVVVESGLKPFDIMALVPIIEAAGGVVTAWTGGSAHLGGQVIAAATPALHAEVRAILAA